MNTRTVRTWGVRVTYREAGSGAPVVLVPGLGLSGCFYDASYSAFASAGLRLIVPDLPGFGGTAPVAGARDIAGLACFLSDFAEALALARAGWLGHSIGAQICLAVAARFPSRTDRLVLVGPTGLAARRRLAREAAGLAREAARAPAGVIAAVARDYLRTTPLRYLRLWTHSARDQPLEHAAVVRAPTLAVIGSRDPVVDRAGLARLLDRLGDARYARVPGAGHGLPREDPIGFHQAVLPFLASRETRTAPAPRVRVRRGPAGWRHPHDAG